jgi:hypothetical protein
MKGIITLITTLCSFLGAQAYTIDFNTATIDPSTRVLFDAGVSYDPQENGEYHQPVILPRDGSPATGPAYLRLSAPGSSFSTKPDSDTDRFEYILCSERSIYCPRFNNVAHTESLWLYIDRGSSEPDRDGVVVAQWWQGDGGAAKYSPPLYLYLTKPASKSDPWGITLNVKNDQTGPEIDDKSVVVWRGSIRPGFWYFYSFTAMPSYTYSGFAQMYQDGVLVGSYKGNVGYKPGDIRGGLPGANAVFRVKFGLYRPSGNPAMAFGFDQVSYR